jgi:hypothetical protein
MCRSLLVYFRRTSDNTRFPQLEDDECGDDAAGIPVRYVKSHFRGGILCQ